MPPSEHLRDLTNEPRAFRLPLPVVTKQSPSLHGIISPRIQRLHYLDSSETFPSEHTSIYDAEPVLSEKNERLEVAGSGDEANPNVPPPHVPCPSSIENISPPLERYLWPAENALRTFDVHFRSSDRWPTTHLNTIAERLSRRTSLPSTSLLRAVSESLELHAVDTAAAGGGFEGSNPEARAQQLVGTCHCRSFSLNDLDCLKPRKAQHLLVHDSSTSSGDALRAACLCEAYPVQPVKRPPIRTPTPPGLPTFGTKEAMEYRMPVSERMSWVPPWRISRIISDGPGTSTNPPSAATVEATATTATTLTDGLKRLLGITRIVSPIPEEPRRAAMPLYLARADDGTFVRGRFGTRHSAHGIGRGQLGAHPFHHDARDTSGTRRPSLERAMQEIDKACTEAERHTTASASPRPHGQSITQSGNGSLRLSGQHALTIAEVLSREPPPNTPVSPGPAPRPVDRAMRSRPSLTFDQLGSRGSIRSQSTAGIDGVRYFVEQGERVSLEQSRQLTKQKKQRSGCANYWFAFCICCCDMDDPDRDIVDASRVMSPEGGFSAVHSPDIRPLRIVHEQPRSQRMVYR